MRKKRYAYRITAPIPLLVGGGMINNSLPGGYLSNYAQKYNPVDTSNVNLPAGTSGVTQQKTNGMGIASGVGAAAGSIFSALASNNRGAIAPDSSTQQTFDSLAGNIPFYQVGNALGDWAATDYKNIQSDPNNADFGKLTDPGKYDVASTISGFLGPDNLISGLSGEGWTAKQRREKIEGQTAPQRQQIVEQQAMQLKQREIGAGLGGRYFDQNQLMQAEMGGPLNVGYYTDAVLGSSMQLGGPISKNYGYTRSDLVPMSNYNGGTDIYAMGGALGNDQLQDAPFANTHLNSKFTPNRFNLAKTGVQGSWKTPGAGMLGALGIADFVGNAAQFYNEYQDVKSSKDPKARREEIEYQNRIERAKLDPTGRDKYLMPALEEGGALGQQPMQPRGSMITSYDGDMSHAESPIQGTPVDEHGNRVVTSNTRPVAKVQGGEISYYSKKAGKSYVFSNDLFID